MIRATACASQGTARFPAVRSLSGLLAAVRCSAFLFASLLAAAVSVAGETSPSSKPVAPAAPAAQNKVETHAGKNGEPAAPALDLEALEKRLRETNAIGVFTKLALKNQVDDLLDRFRAYHDGGVESALAELEQAYELLLMKTIIAVQDGDPSLASAISSSRDAIWSILTDRDKFAALAPGV